MTNAELYDRFQELLEQVAADSGLEPDEIAVDVFSSLVVMEQLTEPEAAELWRTTIGGVYDGGALCDGGVSYWVTWKSTKQKEA